MSPRLLSAGLVLLGSALLGVAGFGYLIPADGPSVTIDEPDRRLADCSPGHAIEVAFRVRNPTDRPIRVVGLAMC